MSSLHLSSGSTQPPKVEGLLRLYSNVFCPYVQRARFVLEAKKIPHDIVNIHLTDKPEWYFKIHPEGKVPAIDDGSKVTVESLVISDLLDEQYPNPPLYPADPASKQKEKDLINKMDPFTTVFIKAVLNDGSLTTEESIDKVVEKLDVFEKELAERKTPYFGGDKPGMVDYMLWPWGERFEVLDIGLGTKFPEEKRLPYFAKWRQAMKKDPVAEKLYISADRFYNLIDARKKNYRLDYDKI